jgi:BA14K-like protein
MLNQKLLSVAIIGAGAWALSGMPANAITLAQMPQPVFQGSAVAEQFIEARHRNDHRQMRRSWDRERHGDRCRTRYGNCRHYYRGYYYATPWWTLPLIGGAYALGAQERSYDRYGNDHVEWCLDRYRSYNVRTNTWVSYSGEVRQCRSPYM